MALLNPPAPTVLEPKKTALDTTTKELSTRFPVLMLTYSDDAEIVHSALAAGARGYLIHGTFDTSVLGDAIRGTVRGQSHLSPGAATVLVQSARGAPAPRAGREVFGLSDREAEIMDLMRRV